LIAAYLFTATAVQGSAAMSTVAVPSPPPTASEDAESLRKALQGNGHIASRSQAMSTASIFIFRCFLLVSFLPLLHFNADAATSLPLDRMASGQGFFDRDPVPADGGAAGGDTARLRLPLPGAPAQLLPLQALPPPPPLRRFLGAPSVHSP
jgi:hypothetical protein